MGRVLGRLKGVDFYRKIPACEALQNTEGCECHNVSDGCGLTVQLAHCRDLTEGSLSGAALSISAAIVMIVLFGAVSPSAGSVVKGV